MQTISVNKNMDYSAPILFLSQHNPGLRSLGEVGTQKKTVPAVTKKPTQTPRATTLAAAPKKPQEKKTVEKAVAAVPKKPEIKSEEKKIEPKKPEPVAETPKPSFAPPPHKATEGLRKASADAVKKETPATPPENKMAKALDTEGDIVPTPAQQVAEPQLPSNAQVSNNYREVEALRRHAQLQKELVQKWHPPIGVSPDCSCDISFFVNNKGIIENIKMVKSSNVTMFDISARQALFLMKMPQWTYGNPLVISFKQ